jgi:rubredoxin
MADEDPRYLECRKCGARDKIQVDLTMNAAVGDGVPWIDTSGRVLDTHDWRCDACGFYDQDRSEVCFIGYPGITEDEKEAQRHE